MVSTCARVAAMVAGVGALLPSAGLAQSCMLTYHVGITYSIEPLVVHHGGMGRTLMMDAGSGFPLWRWEEGPGWLPVFTVGSPTGASQTAAVYDSARDHLVVFGGNTGGSHLASGTTWVWDRSAWSVAATTGPSARYRHGMAYDSARQRTVLFGGRFGQGALGDTWEWDGQAWTQVASSGPSARWQPVMTYDPVRGRTVLYGGYVPGSGEIADWWEWDGSQWVEISAALPGPHVRWMTFDTARERIVMGRQVDTAYYEPMEIWEQDVHSSAWVLRHPAVQYAGNGGYDPPSGTVLFHRTRYHPSGTLVSGMVTQQPVGGSFPGGSTVVLSVEASGTAPFTYQWRRNGQAIQDGAKYSGTATPTLSIFDLNYLDDGGFDVVITTACNTMTSYAAGVSTHYQTGCYPNCDGSTVEPILNVADFTCFVQRFAAGHPYANCDSSYTAPPLNVADFGCFLAKFAAGCR